MEPDVDREMIEAIDAELVQVATGLAREFVTSPDCVAASVAAALRTRRGNVYTGVNIDVRCSLGFCAEHAAIAEMLKARESEVAAIVAVDENNGILPPCGRCRELLWQVSASNQQTRVILSPERSLTLGALLPSPYRPRQGGA